MPLQRPVRAPSAGRPATAHACLCGNGGFLQNVNATVSSCDPRVPCMAPVRVPAVAPFTVEHRVGRVRSVKASGRALRLPRSGHRRGSAGGCVVGELRRLPASARRAAGVCVRNRVRASCGERAPDSGHFSRSSNARTWRRLFGCFSALKRRRCVRRCSVKRLRALAPYVEK